MGKGDSTSSVGRNSEFQNVTPQSAARVDFEQLNAEFENGVYLHNCLRNFLRICERN